jgi:predicted transcriptional regulator
VQPSIEYIYDAIAIQSEVSYGTGNISELGGFSMADELAVSDVLAFTAQIVSAHVGANSVAADVLPDLIREVHRAVAGLASEPAPAPERPQPAVPIKKSIYPDYIVCLEDGKKLKMLKRHLMSAYNMTPDQYRERWGLGSDYPMVAPNYAQHRSTLAKKIGLGTGSRNNG